MENHITLESHALVVCKMRQKKIKLKHKGKLKLYQQHCLGEKRIAALKCLVHVYLFFKKYL